ncbi:uncharacterized protein ACIB01_007698 isoform 2-T2 [Guaruba guarouba]
MSQHQDDLLGWAWGSYISRRVWRLFHKSMNKWHSLSTPSSSAGAPCSISSLMRSSRACPSLYPLAASSHWHSPTNPNTWVSTASLQISSHSRDGGAEGLLLSSLISPFFLFSAEGSRVVLLEHMWMSSLPWPPKGGSDPGGPEHGEADVWGARPGQTPKTIDGNAE